MGFYFCLMGVVENEGVKMARNEPDKPGRGRIAGPGRA